MRFCMTETRPLSRAQAAIVLRQTRFGPTAVAEQSRDNAHANEATHLDSTQNREIAKARGRVPKLGLNVTRKTGKHATGEIDG